MLTPSSEPSKPSTSSSVDSRYGSPDPGGIPMQPMRGPQQRMRSQGDDLLDISPSKSQRASSSTSAMVDLEDSIKGTIRKGHQAMTMDPVRVIVFLIIIASLICFITLGTSIPPPEREFNDVARPKEVSSVFLNACGSGEVRAFQAIVERYGRTLTTTDRQLCGHYALQGGQKGYLAIVSTLLGMGVDPREEDPSGMSLIEVACAEGREEAFGLILEKDESLCGDDLYYYAGKAPTREFGKKIISVIKEKCSEKVVEDSDRKWPEETPAMRADEKKRNYESEWSDIASQEKYSKEIASLKDEIVKWRDRAFDAVKQKHDLVARIAVLESELKSREKTAPPQTDSGKEEDKYEKLWRESKVLEKPLTGGPANELISSPLPPPNPLRYTFLT